MTNDSNDRLERSENDLETVKGILVAVARRAESTDSRLDRLVESQDRTQRQLDQLSGKVDQLTGSVEQLTGSVEQLREDVDIAFQTITALSDNTDRTIASINASIQRQDRILDYLMRRDGNGGVL